MTIDVELRIAGHLCGVQSFDEVAVLPHNVIYTMVMGVLNTMLDQAMGTPLRYRHSLLYDDVVFFVLHEDGRPTLAFGPMLPMAALVDTICGMIKIALPIEELSIEAYRFEELLKNVDYFYHRYGVSSQFLSI